MLYWIGKFGANRQNEYLKNRKKSEIAKITTRL